MPYRPRRYRPRRRLPESTLAKALKDLADMKIGSATVDVARAPPRVKQALKVLKQSSARKRNARGYKFPYRGVNQGKPVVKL